MDGYEFPKEITRQKWGELKKCMDDTNPDTAFAGFGCSFSAVYFATYARPCRGVEDPVVFAARTNRSIARLVREMRLHNVELHVRDYSFYKGYSGAVFYLDPPYAGGYTKYDGKEFDHERFWDFVRELSVNNKVIVTERTFPADFKVLHTFGDTTTNAFSNSLGSSVSKQPDECIITFSGGVVSKGWEATT